VEWLKVKALSSIPVPQKKTNKQTKNKKKPHLKQGWRCGSVVEHFPHMCKALGSIPALKKKKKKP
jgi:hypothetical protein